MKVYICQNSEGQFATEDFFIAYDGFRKMGWEIQGVKRTTDFAELEPDNVVVGYVSDIHRALTKLGKEIPPELNYPDELHEFLGRKIWRSRINYIASHPELWNVFVKPAQRSKKFTGRVVRSTKDLIGCGDATEDTEIYCTEVVNFVSEWRCFVRYGEIMDVRRYKGDWRSHFDPAVIEKMVQLYTSAPNAYVLDVGVTDENRTLLVEVNNGYAAGGYGIESHDYAKFLSARWAQMTGSEDYANF